MGIFIVGILGLWKFLKEDQRQWILLRSAAPNSAGLDALVNGEPASLIFESLPLPWFEVPAIW